MSNISNVDANTLYKLSYGLYVISAKDGGKDNGCIINTACQVTNSPIRISVAVNKQNYTNDMIRKTGVFNLSVLSEDAPFSVFEHFGFKSGKDTDKYEGRSPKRTANGVVYESEYCCAVISAKVISETDLGTHTLYIADVTEAFTLNDSRPQTYAYYFENVKPKPQAKIEESKGYVCKICGYVYEGEPLPDDFICPWCKHGAEDFEKIV